MSVQKSPALNISTVALGLLTLCACVQTGTLASSPTSSATTTTTTTTTSSSTTPPPVGQVDNTKGFQIWTDNGFYTIHGDGQTAIGTHTYAASMVWTNPATCIATSGQDVMCYIEAPELDLWFNGLDVQYNIPANMCDYATVDLPWYYMAPAGLGGATVAYSTGPSADQTNSSQSHAYCPFDYSKLPGAVPGPNCCEGNYTQTITSGGVEGAPSTASWGGSASNCVAGPGADLEKKDVNGFPVATIYNSENSGLAGAITPKTPSSVPMYGNTYVANYFDIAAGKDYDTLLAADYPPAYAPGANPALVNMAAGGYTIPGSSPATPVTGVEIYGGGHPFYTFTCYTNYMEVVARIRVAVRSWDNANEIGSVTNYYPNYAKEGGVGATEPNHDFRTWGDLFFNYGDNAHTVASGTFRQTWASTAVDASCTVGAYVPGTNYTAANPPCNLSSSMGIDAGFPGFN